MIADFELLLDTIRLYISKVTFAPLAKTGSVATVHLRMTYSSATRNHKYEAGYMLQSHHVLELSFRKRIIPSPIQPD